MPGLLLSTASLVRGGCCAVALALAGCSGPPPAAPTAPRWAADSASVRVAAGPQYARGAAWRFFWGTHYRPVWATPVTAPVLRLATAGPGGLAPLQAGGSYQSRTLRLATAGGREFVLRSVDKDASAALPTPWLRRLLGGLMKDQTSAALPYGAYVGAPLAEAAGVYHTNPRLVFLPDDPRLGKFRASYANALYLLEERPDGDQRAAASFGHSPQVVNTARMLAAIHRQARAGVAARAYLRARLLDIWLGDWSRREDQWRWASFPGPAGVTYRPIPRDRDQAFFLFNDGAITRLISWAVPKYHSFRAVIPLGTVGALTTTARALDKTLLGALNAEDFRQEADSLRRRLTDAAIDQALLAGPPETRAAIANRLAPLLRARREQLRAVAQQYYEVLAAEAWLVGTDEAERFVVSQAAPGRVRVRMLAHRPQRPDSLLAERVYDRHTTRRLNLYGLGGTDILELPPSLEPGFDVSFYGGAGPNQLRIPRAASCEISGVTWFGPADTGAAQSAQRTGLPLKSDAQPELSANSQGWLKRYRLRD